MVEIWDAFLDIPNSFEKKNSFNTKMVGLQEGLCSFLFLFFFQEVFADTHLLPFFLVLRWRFELTGHGITTPVKY